MAGDTVIGREPCPKCRESGGDDKGDNFARYDDGHAHCFKCDHHEKAAGVLGVMRRPEDAPPWETWDRPNVEEGCAEVTAPPSANNGLLTGIVSSIKARMLTEETCRRYGYLQGHRASGLGCQIAPYRDDSGRVVAQKLRFARVPDKNGIVTKDMPWVGDSRAKLQLFGQHLQSKGRMLVVTEGEIDALSVSQALGNKWPAVSIRRGAASAKKDLLEQSDWLRGFDKVVLCFDMDDAGRKASEECARALGPIVPVHAAVLPEGTKDASDLLQAGREAELAKAIWEAPRWRPKGILRASEVRRRVGKQPAPGTPWPWPTLTSKTYGQRPGELAVWGGGTGCGKTEVMLTLQAEDIRRGEKVAIFSSEQLPEEVMRGLAGKLMGRRFHIPDGGWTERELEEGLDLIEKAEVAIYDRREDFTWPSLREHIRYLMDGEGYRSIYGDNLTAMMAHVDDERRSLDGCLEEAAGLASSHRARFNFVSHLNPTKNGPPHEEGGQVSEVQFAGSRAIVRWAAFVLGIERNKQAENPSDRHKLSIRVCKDRYTGNGDGFVLPLQFDQSTGLLREDNGFSAVTNEDF